MASGTWHLWNLYVVTAIILAIVGIQVSDVSGQIEKQPWYETMPAVAMDYKVHLDAGKEDCYYQYVQPGASLYVSFQVSVTGSECMFCVCCLC